MAGAGPGRTQCSIVLPSPTAPTAGLGDPVRRAALGLCCGRPAGSGDRMADYSHKQGKRRDDNGLGGLVDFLLANARVVLGVSGAAVLALATLAVKRLIDRATSSPDDDDDIKAKQKSLEESWQELSLIKVAPKVQREDLEEPLLTPVTLQEPKGSVQTLENPAAESKNLLCLTFQEKLCAFYKDCVCVSEAEKALGKQLVENISAEFQSFLKSKCPELPLGNASLSGFLCDGLVHSKRLEVLMMLPLALEPHLWHLIPGEQTVVNNPWFGMLKRTGLEYFPRGNSPWDRFLVGGYLSSNTLHEVLHKVLVTSVNWPVIGSVLDCVILPEMAPKMLKLAVRHRQISLDLTLCPVVEAEGKTLVATSLEEPVENLWQQSFRAAEVSTLKDLDARDSGVRQRCTNILKVVFEDHPFWSKLASHPLTHAVLHLSETEADWSEDALSDRCRQVLEALVQYLEQGSLPSFFDSRINLLSQLSLEEIEEIGYTLYEALAEPDLATGLCL